MPHARRTSLWRMIADQVRDPLVMVLLVAAALTLGTGDWTDAGVILLVIVVNTAAGVTQEVKAGQAIVALSELTAPEARVLRNRAFASLVDVGPQEVTQFLGVPVTQIDLVAGAIERELDCLVCLSAARVVDEDHTYLLRVAVQ